jgi:hypothetical protein
MLNLGFEFWWAGGTTTLLTIQPQAGSSGMYIMGMCNSCICNLGMHILSIYKLAMRNMGMYTLGYV